MDHMDAARQICQEARIVLSSLRGGPPTVARGTLAQGLYDLRVIVRSTLPHLDEEKEEDPQQLQQQRQLDVGLKEDHREQQDSSLAEEEDKVDSTSSEDVNDYVTVSMQVDGQTEEVKEQEDIKKHPNLYPHPHSPTQPHHHVPLEDAGPYAKPFLAVILDPRAAGPHTLVALRSLYRLLERGALILPSSASTFPFTFQIEPFMRGVLDCRFEQTDAGADEAVEMAIADLLRLIVQLDCDGTDGSNDSGTSMTIHPNTLMEAFNTVFVTRNTFVHSPALCYHFEEVLHAIVTAIFSSRPNCQIGAQLILDFLVGQLLHTPFNGAENGGGNVNTSFEANSVVSGNAEANALHDATRVLCLRLIQQCLRTYSWDHCSNMGTTTSEDITAIQDGILHIVQDNLCLSLLMVGQQAVWDHRDPSSLTTPGVISLEVLSEICSTISTLWNISPLRALLTAQFENIFTGFYQRALSLLRQLSVPDDSATFHANMIFDAEMEIILESLVDILCLNGDDDCQSRIPQERNHAGGTLETLFVTYDCDKNRQDVASSLIIELSRCCGGDVNEDVTEFKSQTVPASPTTTHPSDVSAAGQARSELRENIPAHLKELCAEAMIGTIKSLFKGAEGNDDNMNVENDGKTVFNLSSDEDVQPLSCRFIKQQKKLMRQAAYLFNEKSSKGIEFLVSSGLLASPVTPTNVASFLRNGIVIGLDKTAVGEYLGEKGKAPIAGKSPPCWERDRFHKDVLQAYCSSFDFVNQSLLDGLRMFLAAFRLPGEAQQIDRILQAFAETCGQYCKERRGIFSEDPKRAADAAYLLSFSIIMLNTDLHNDNIRADRKMSADAFVKNNTDYGRDITEEGKEFPREYLESIYMSIRDEQIRTEGEGADGVMTFERWKDVLRGGGSSVLNTLRSTDTNDLKKLIVETIWQPILSAIGSFWGVKSTPKSHGMLGAQGARLGMDLSTEMLSGLRSLSCANTFQDFFIRMCKYTGLIGKYNADAVERTDSFVTSVERQSIVIICIRTAIECGHYIGFDGWKCVWGILFELRDLKLLGGGRKNKHRSLIVESDIDLLRPDSKREWEMQLVKEYYEAAGGVGPRSTKSPARSSLFGAVGRAFFGSDTESSSESEPLTVDVSQTTLIKPTRHGKEELVLWDDLAPSDVEEEESNADNMDNHVVENASSGTIGFLFEKKLIQEDQTTVQPTFTTGLETYEDSHVYQMSPRARVRKRLLSMCDFSAIVSETKYLHINSVIQQLSSLVDIINAPNMTQLGQNVAENKSPVSSPSEYTTVVSPASEALAEILLCEIAIRNRDRIATIWKETLKEHYFHRLSALRNKSMEASHAILTKPGIEKCVTGLLRICYHTINRDDINNQIVQSLQLLYPSEDGDMPITQMPRFDRQISEGLWRICRDVNGLCLIDSKSWHVLLGLINYCAQKGEQLSTHPDQQSGGNLSDDDPSLQAFRCTHLMLHSNELRGVVPLSIVRPIRSLIEGGERRFCPKLCVAALDLLLLLHTRLQSLVSDRPSMSKSNAIENVADEDSVSVWLHIVRALALASESMNPGVRQHSISMLTDVLVDTNGPVIPVDEICGILNGLCIPMAGKRIAQLLNDITNLELHKEEILIELELCISIVFKPFVHHLKGWMSNPNDFSSMWMSILDVTSHLLTLNPSKEEKKGTKFGNAADVDACTSLLITTQELAAEHVRNAVMLLLSNEFIKLMEEDELVACDCEVDISFMTWKTIMKIPFCHKFVPEWREATIKE